MRKLIRSKATRAFLSAKGDWTFDFREAQVFSTDDVFQRILQERQFQDCELYYSFSDLGVSEFDFAIPLQP